MVASRIGKKFTIAANTNTISLLSIVAIAALAMFAIHYLYKQQRHHAQSQSMMTIGEMIAPVSADAVGGGGGNIGSGGMLNFGPGQPVKNEDVLMNPYVPPLRDNTSMGVGGGDSRLRLRVNVPTQSIDTTYRQVGILTRPHHGGGSNGDGHNVMLPLMGRPLFTNRDKWNFYTMNDKNNAIKLPVIIKGKSGTNEYGCDNVYSGDTVYVEGYNDAFKVTIYDNATVRYLPIL